MNDDLALSHTKHERRLFRDWYSRHPKRPGGRYEQHMNEHFTAGFRGDRLPSIRLLGDAGVAYRAGQEARNT